MIKKVVDLSLTYVVFGNKVDDEEKEKTRRARTTTSSQAQLSIASYIRNNVFQTQHV